MTIQLRPRQHQALADLRQAYASGSRAPILVAATGFGKTATATEIVRQAVAKGRSVWFLAHLREILDDTSARLTAGGISHGQHPRRAGQLITPDGAGGRGADRRASPELAAAAL
jgi:superfamily II DNA or RNA helicase